MVANRAHRHLLALPALMVLLSLGAVLTLPTAKADSSVGAFSSPQTVLGQSGENYAWVSASGGTTGDVGFAFQRSTSGDTGFAKGTFATGFSVKTNDIDSTETSIKRPYVLRVDDSTWFIAAANAPDVTGTEQYLYKTTNGGTTWTQIQLATGPTNCYAPPTLAYDSVANTLFWTRCKTSGFGAELLTSTDLGTSFVVRISRTYSSANTNFPMIWAGVDSTNTAVYELWEAEGLSASGPNRNHVGVSSSADGVYWSTHTEKDQAGACGNSCTGNHPMAVRGHGSSRAIAWDGCVATACSSTSPRYSNDGGNTWANLSGAVINPCQTDADGNSYAYATSSGLYFSGSPASTPSSVIGSYPSTNGVHCTVISGGRLYFLYSDQSNSGQLRVQSAAISIATAAVPGRSPIFCSAIGNEHFGYNYDEDIGTLGADGRIGIDVNGYVFQGDADNFAYMGLGLSPGTKAAKVFFKIEAQAEGTSSVFRAVFSFIDPTPYLTGTDPVLFTSAAKGNGLDTASFDDYLEVKFTETDNDWNIKLIYVAPGGSRTQLGQAVMADNPNTASSYSLQVDTRSGQSYVSVTRADGSVIGTGVLNKTLSGVSSNHFLDKTIRQQWFVGYATDNFVNADAFTHLEDKSTTASTCVYTLEAANAVKIGDPGASGPSLNETGVPQDIVDPNDTGDPEPGEFSNSIFSFLIAGGVTLTGSEVGGRLFATIILILGFAGVGAAGLSRPAVKGYLGEDGWVWGLLIGAALGFLLAIGTSVFPKVWAFVGVLIAGIAVAVYSYGRRR